jgi:hypothetical protein
MPLKLLVKNACLLAPRKTSQVFCIGQQERRLECISESSKTTDLQPQQGKNANGSTDFPGKSFAKTAPEYTGTCLKVPTS